MADIRSQYLRLKPEVDEAMARVLESGAFIKGPEVTQLRRELEAFLGIPHAIPCANGTDALQIALMALDLEPGDEVITPNFTFISTVEVLQLLKLKPVPVDVDPETFNIDPERIPQAVTGKTRAIIPVHLFGQPAPMEAINRIARKHHLAVVEDNAQSLGSEHTEGGKKVKTGSAGLISTTSFFPTKPLACYGDGGAVFTSDPQLAEKMEMIANHGARIKYQHEITGINSRLDTLQAAILRVNLRHLNDFILRRQEVASYYDQRFSGCAGIQVPGRVADGTHIYHQYTIRIDPAVRDAVRSRLNGLGIPTMVYYPVPVSLQKVFSSAGFREGDFPVSEALCRSVLSLPIHTEMDEEQLEYISTNLIKILSDEQS